MGNIRWHQIDGKPISRTENTTRLINVKWRNKAIATAAAKTDNPLQALVAHRVFEREREMKYKNTKRKIERQQGGGRDGTLS